MKRGTIKILVGLFAIMLLSVSFVSAGFVTDLFDRFSGGGFSLITGFGIFDAVHLATGKAYDFGFSRTKTLSLPLAKSSGSVSCTKNSDCYGKKLTSTISCREYDEYADDATLTQMGYLSDPGNEVPCVCGKTSYCQQRNLVGSTVAKGGELKACNSDADCQGKTEKCLRPPTVTSGGYCKEPDCTKNADCNGRQARTDWYKGNFHGSAPCGTGTDVPLKCVCSKDQWCLPRLFQGSDSCDNNNDCGYSETCKEGKCVESSTGGQLIPAIQIKPSLLFPEEGAAEGDVCQDPEDCSPTQICELGKCKELEGKELEAKQIYDQIMEKIDSLNERLDNIQTGGEGDGEQEDGGIVAPIIPSMSNVKLLPSIDLSNMATQVRPGTLVAESLPSESGSSGARAAPTCDSLSEFPRKSAVSEIVLSDSSMWPLEQYDVQVTTIMPNKITLQVTPVTFDLRYKPLASKTFTMNRVKGQEIRINCVFRIKITDTGKDAQNADYVNLQLLYDDNGKSAVYKLTTNIGDSIISPDGRVIGIEYLREAPVDWNCCDGYHPSTWRVRFVPYADNNKGLELIPHEGLPDWKSPVNFGSYQELAGWEGLYADPSNIKKNKAKSPGAVYLGPRDNGEPLSLRYHQGTKYTILSKGIRINYKSPHDDRKYVYTVFDKGERQQSSVLKRGNSFKYGNDMFVEFSRKRISDKYWAYHAYAEVETMRYKINLYDKDYNAGAGEAVQPITGNFISMQPRTTKGITSTTPTTIIPTINPQRVTQPIEAQTPLLYTPYKMGWYKNVGMPLLDGELIELESRICSMAKDYEIYYGDLVLYDEEQACTGLKKLDEPPEEETGLVPDTPDTATPALQKTPPIVSPVLMATKPTLFRRILGVRK